MLTERQRQLLQLLSKHELTGEELAKSLQVSSRTILRDIAEINYYLQKQAIGMILSDYSGDGYYLKIDQQDSFNLIVRQKSDLALDILLELCLHSTSTMSDLQEKTFASKSAIITEIGRLKQKFSQTLTLTSSPNRGYFIEESYSVRLFVAANILKERDWELATLLALPQEKLDASYQIVKEKQQIWREYFPYLASRDFYFLCLVAFNMQNNVHSQTAPQDLTSFLASFYQMLGLPITTNNLADLASHFSQIEQQYTRLNSALIQQSINLAKEVYRFDFADQSLYSNLLEHLERSLSFPSFLNNLTEEMAVLIDMNPLIYDFTTYFIQVLEKEAAIRILDQNFIFLYFLSFKNNEKSGIRIQLYSDRWAIATINKRMIEDAIPEATVECSIDNQPKTSHADFILWNKEEKAPLSLAINMSFQGIIDPEQLTRLKAAIDSDSVKKTLLDVFTDDYFFILDAPEPQWHRLIKACCTQLLAAGLIVQSEAEQLLAREAQGNSLVVNHVGIPHGTSTRTSYFAIFNFYLAQPVKRNNTTISQLLFVLVNPDKRENNHVFPYLYKKLNRCPEALIQHASSFETLKNILVIGDYHEPVDKKTV